MRNHPLAASIATAFDVGGEAPGDRGTTPNLCRLRGDGKHRAEVLADKGVSSRSVLGEMIAIRPILYPSRNGVGVPSSMGKKYGDDWVKVTSNEASAARSS